MLTLYTNTQIMLPTWLEKEPPIFHHIFKGDLKNVREYIEQKGEINLESSHGISLLAFAVLQKKNDIIRLLIDAEASISGSIKNYKKNYNTYHLNMQKMGQDLSNLTSEEAQKISFSAISEKDIATVFELYGLLAISANTTAIIGGVEMTPLLCALVPPLDIHIALVIIGTGFNVNAPLNKIHWTALMFATFSEQVESTRLVNNLLRCGADPSLKSQDEGGQNPTALQIALEIAIKLPSSSGLLDKISLLVEFSNPTALGDALHVVKMPPKSLLFNAFLKGCLYTPVLSFECQFGKFQKEIEELVQMFRQKIAEISYGFYRSVTIFGISFCFDFSNDDLEKIDRGAFEEGGIIERLYPSAIRPNTHISLERLRELLTQLIEFSFKKQQWGYQPCHIENYLEFNAEVQTKEDVLDYLEELDSILEIRKTLSERFSDNKLFCQEKELAIFRDVFERRFSAVEECVKQDKNAVNLKTAHGPFPLSLLQVAIQGGSNEIVRLLIDNGADIKETLTSYAKISPNPKSLNLWTKLHESERWHFFVDAIDRGDIISVMILLGGSFENAKTLNPVPGLRPPLIHACDNGDFHIVQVLVAAGVPVDSMDEIRKLTALGVALLYASNKIKLEDPKRSHEILNYLVSQGADLALVNLKDFLKGYINYTILLIKKDNHFENEIERRKGNKNFKNEWEELRKIYTEIEELANMFCENTEAVSIGLLPFFANQQSTSLSPCLYINLSKLKVSMHSVDKEKKIEKALFRQVIRENGYRIGVSLDLVINQLFKRLVIRVLQEQNYQRPHFGVAFDHFIWSACRERRHDILYTSKDIKRASEYQVLSSESPIVQQVLQADLKGITEYIVNKGNVNFKTRDGIPLLTLAANEDHNDVVRCLISAGANIEEAVLCYPKLLQNGDLAKSFVKRDIFQAEIRQKNIAYIMTLFGISALNKNDINLMNVSPLTMACHLRDIPMIQLFLAMGVDVNHINIKQNSETALLATLSAFASAPQDELKNVSIILNYLLKHDADVNFKTPNGWTALRQAVQYKLLLAVELLGRYSNIGIIDDTILQCNTFLNGPLFHALLRGVLNSTKQPFLSECPPQFKKEFKSLFQAFCQYVVTFSNGFMNAKSYGSKTGTLVEPAVLLKISLLQIPLGLNSMMFNQFWKSFKNVEPIGFSILGKILAQVLTNFISIVTTRMWICKPMDFDNYIWEIPKFQAEIEKIKAKGDEQKLKEEGHAIIMKLNGIQNAFYKLEQGHKFLIQQISTNSEKIKEYRKEKQELDAQKASKRGRTVRVNSDEGKGINEILLTVAEEWGTVWRKLEQISQRLNTQKRIKKIDGKNINIENDKKSKKETIEASLFSEERLVQLRQKFDEVFARAHQRINSEIYRGQYQKATKWKESLEDLLKQFENFGSKLVDADRSLENQIEFFENQLRRGKNRDKIVFANQKEAERATEIELARLEYEKKIKDEEQLKNNQFIARLTEERKLERERWEKEKEVRRQYEIKRRTAKRQQKEQEIKKAGETVLLENRDPLNAVQDVVLPADSRTSVPGVFFDNRRARRPGERTIDTVTGLSARVKVASTLETFIKILNSISYSDKQQARKLNDKRILIERYILLGISAQIMECIKNIKGLTGFPKAIAQKFRDVVFHGYNLLPRQTSDLIENSNFNARIKDMALDLANFLKTFSDNKSQTGDRKNEKELKQLNEQKIRSAIIAPLFAEILDYQKQQEPNLHTCKKELNRLEIEINKLEEYYKVGEYLTKSEETMYHAKGYLYGMFGTYAACLRKLDKWEYNRFTHSNQNRKQYIEKGRDYRHVKDDFALSLRGGKIKCS